MRLRRKHRNRRHSYGHKHHSKSHHFWDAIGDFFEGLFDAWN